MRRTAETIFKRHRIGEIAESLGDKVGSLNEIIGSIVVRVDAQDLVAGNRLEWRKKQSKVRASKSLPCGRYALQKG